MFAVVIIQGSHLALVKALHETEEAANADKKNHPHPFGTYVYPVSNGSCKVGIELLRKPEYEC